MGYPSTGCQSATVPVLFLPFCTPHIGLAVRRFFRNFLTNLAIDNYVIEMISLRHSFFFADLSYQRGGLRSTSFFLPHCWISLLINGVARAQWLPNTASKHAQALLSARQCALQNPYSDTLCTS